MNWFRKVIGKRKENPFYVKLKKVLPEYSDERKIKKALYMGGSVYSTDHYDILLKAIAENKIDSFLKEVKYDTQRDNIELYGIEDESGKCSIIIILDPLDLYAKEEILKVIPYDIGLLSGLVTEQIYP